MRSSACFWLCEWAGIAGERGLGIPHVRWYHQMERMPIRPHASLPLLLSLIRQLLCDPPSVGAVLAHSSAGHGMTHVELAFAPLVFVTLGVVGRRAPSAMTAIRARDSNGWPSFRADEMVSVDGASATT